MWHTTDGGIYRFHAMRHEDCAARARSPGGRKPRLNRADREARKLYDEGAHTVARTGPDYLCAEVDVYLDTTGTPPAETA